MSSVLKENTLDALYGISKTFMNLLYSVFTSSKIKQSLRPQIRCYKKIWKKNQNY